MNVNSNIGTEAETQLKIR